MKVPMRDRLLDAGWAIVRERGLAAATTRNIAGEAGVAEGSIYKHFEDKTELVLALVMERAGDIRGIFAGLLDNAGKHSVAENVAAALFELIDFYENVQILIAGSLSDPETMTRMRQVFRERSMGPQRAHVAMVAYLEAERALGRIDSNEVSPETLSALLLGAVHERAFLNRINGESMSVGVRRAFARAAAEALFGRQQSGDRTSDAG